MEAKAQFKATTRVAGAALFRPSSMEQTFAHAGHARASSVTWEVRSGHGRDSWQLLDGGVDSRLRELDVLELAGEVGVIRGHVEVPVTGEPKENRQRGSGLASRRRLFGHRHKRMRGFRCG